MPRTFVVMLLLILTCCDRKEKSQASASRAFYYWKTELNDFNWDDSTYLALDISKLYLRFFDIDWSKEANAPIPVSPLNLKYSHFRDSSELVPVVFIANETFKHLTISQSRELARNTYTRIMAQCLFLTESGFFSLPYNTTWWEQDPYKIKSKNFDEQHLYDSMYAAQMNSIDEIQFDCDWTPTTRDKYFAFLEESKNLFTKKMVSSTIRLYQYKYPKEAGVPPVKRGMLMCYNAGDIKSIRTKNSIFDKKEIMQYLRSDVYPIDLDYALPIFEWAILFRRGELINILPASKLRSNYSQYLRFSNADGIGNATVVEEFVFGNTAESVLIRNGDEIRFEQPDMNDVKVVADWLSENRRSRNATLAFYHLNEYDLKKHSKEISDMFLSF